MLAKLHEQVGRIVGLSLTASLEPLAHCENIVSLGPFHRYYFGRYLCKLAELAPLPRSGGESTNYF